MLQVGDQQVDDLFRLKAAFELTQENVSDSCCRFVPQEIGKYNSVSKGFMESRMDTSRFLGVML